MEDPPVQEQDPGEGPPIVEPNERVPITGSVEELDGWLSGAPVPVEGASVEALGVYGVQPATSNADGSYEIEVPQNGRVILSISKPGHLSSFEVIAIGDRYVEAQTTYLASESYAAAIGDAYGVDAGQYALLVGRVLDDADRPVDGVTAAGFTVEGANFRGPYLLRGDGQPDSTVTETENGLFVVFVEVPQGSDSIDLSIKAQREYEGTTYYYGPRSAKVFQGGLALAAVSETGRDVEPPPPQIENIDFDTQVYPLLLSVFEGGLGCTGCHTNANGAAPAAGLNLYGGPAAAYAALDPASYPDRVNLDAPAESLLLTKPLYEVEGPQDHPIFAFLSSDDPQYQIIYNWIREGAQRGGVVVEEASFYRDVYPMLTNDYLGGGAGCRACHIDGANNANNAPGKLYLGGTPEDVYNALTRERPRDAGRTGEEYRVNVEEPSLSLVLTNPLDGSDEPHPVRIFYGVEDPRYQAVYRWIAAGAGYDAP